MRNLKSHTVPKYIKGETLWAFAAKYQKNLKVGPFEGKKSWKKSSKVPEKLK